MATAIKVLLSLLITNWIYAEIVLFCPAVDDFVSRVIAVLAIPTHDKWPDIANSPEAKRLGRELEDSVIANSGSFGGGSEWFDLASLRARWHDYGSGARARAEAVQADYVSGPDIFSAGTSNVFASSS